jgi:hypothetical protein
MAVPRRLAAIGAVVAAAVAVALVGLPARPASAHAGDGLSQPIIEQITPALPGITLQVAYSANYELLVENAGQEAITFLADTGEPFLRVGPKGVEANFASPTFYNSNSPVGLEHFPDQARPGAAVPPIWRRISAQPNWGWYDHRLHPTESYVAPEIIKAGKVAVLGRWTVPFRIGDRPGEIDGRFEYRPPKGSYAAVQKSSITPAAGLKIQVVSASTVPAVFVENFSPDPVVILGRDNEPFARIGPKASEVNVRSPTWAQIQQALGHDPSAEADAAAEPKWQQVADGPRWEWLEFRAAAPKTDPPDRVIAAGRAVTVRNWSIPYLVGGQRRTIDGVTQFLPVAELRRRAAGRTGSTDGSPVGRYAAIAGAAAAVLAGGWLITSVLRRRTAAKWEPWTS